MASAEGIVGLSIPDSTAGASEEQEVWTWLFGDILGQLNLDNNLVSLLFAMISRDI